MRQFFCSSITYLILKEKGCETLWLSGGLHFGEVKNCLDSSRCAGQVLLTFLIKKKSEASLARQVFEFIQMIEQVHKFIMKSCIIHAAESRYHHIK